MNTIPIQVMGPSYKDRSPQLSSQYTQNVYLAPARAGESPWASYDWPGCKPFYTGSGLNRGMIKYLDEIYKVNGTDLISVNANGLETVRGSVPGIGRCIFAISWDDALESYGLLIATDGVRYYYDQTNVTPISDTDLSTGNSVAVMNDVAIFDNPDGDLVHSTQGSPTSVESFFATTNTTPDGLNRVYVYGQILYAMGYDSIEIWTYNGATTSFIFSRQEQATIPMGLAAKESVSNDENYVYFLGSNKRIYRLRQSLIEPIGNPGTIDEIEKMTVISDAIGFCLTLANQSFYVLTFPTENKTFVYSATHNEWGHLAHGTDADNPDRHLAEDYVLFNNKHYVSDHRNGNIYEWDFDTYTDNGDPRLRIRVMSPLTGAQIGLLGRSLTVGSLHLDMEVGVGLASGQGVNPMLICSVSGDGGKTFSAESFVPIGEMGNYTNKTKYDRFMTGRSIVYRIKCSDPVYLSVFGGAADVADGGY